MNWLIFVAGIGVGMGAMTLLMMTLAMFKELKKRDTDYSE